MTDMDFCLSAAAEIFAWNLPDHGADFFCVHRQRFSVSEIFLTREVPKTE